MNYFEKYKGQLLVVNQYTDKSIDVAPMGTPSAETLINASKLARDYSIQVGVFASTVWSPDEEAITVFHKGKVLDLPENKRAGIQ